MKGPFHLSEGERTVLAASIGERPRRSPAEARQKFLEAANHVTGAAPSGWLRSIWWLSVAAVVVAVTAIWISTRAPLQPRLGVAESPIGATQYVHALSSGTLIVYVPPKLPKEVRR